MTLIAMLLLRPRNKINSKASFILGGREEIFQAKSEEDYSRRDFTGRIIYQITEVLLFNGGVGRSWIDYDQRKDDQSFLWDVGFIYQTGPRWKAEFMFKQDDPHSVDDGLSNRKRVEASFSYLERLPTKVEFYAEKQKFQTKDLEDRKIGGNVAISFPFRNRFNLDLSGGVTAYRFLPEEENVFRYDVGVSAGYRLKMGLLSGGYRYEFRDSDLDVNEYQNNRLFIQYSIQI
ncbi:MAG: hypothetical protein R2864_13745 [Syntrophotaleaceae bacterium]